MRLSPFSLLLAPLLVLAACKGVDVCDGIECLPAGTHLTFSIVDSSGRDLVFGPGARYHVDSLRIIRPQGDNQAVQPALGSKDSALNLTIADGPQVLYLALSSTDVDTLSLGFDVYQDQCCGTSFGLKSLRYNNGPVLTAFGGRLTFQK